MNTDSSSTRHVRPISLPAKTQLSAIDKETSLNRPSIRQLASYYEYEARKIQTPSSQPSGSLGVETLYPPSMESTSHVSVQSTSPQYIQKRSFEDIIVPYNDKIRKLEDELIMVRQKTINLREYISDIMNKNIDPQIELLELSSLYNEEIIILGSIYTYNQIVKNIIKNGTL